MLNPQQAGKRMKDLAGQVIDVDLAAQEGKEPPA